MGKEDNNNSTPERKVVSLDDYRERISSPELEKQRLISEAASREPDEAQKLRSFVEPEAEVEKIAKAWMKRLRGLQETSTRINRLFQGLQENTEEMGALFEYVSGRLGHSLCRTLYLDFLRLLSGARSISYEIREKLYMHARERKMPLLRVLALQSQSYSTKEAPHPSLVADFASMDPELHEVSLGRRKTLARTANMDLVQRLSRDPDPRVIQILLCHPKLTEKELIKIASRRPASPAALSEVIHHERWGARPSAQEAIALNPYSPSGLAAALLPMLPSKVRKQVLTGLNAQPLVRAVAEALEGDSSSLDTMLNR